MGDDFRRSETIRAQRFWDAFSRLTGGTEPVPAARLFANKARDVNTAKPSDLADGDIAALARLADEALQEAQREAKAHNPDNPFAQFQAMEQARTQMRAMLQTVHMPESLSNSSDYLKLLKDLSPKDARGEQSDFQRRTAMQGKVRSGVIERQVHEALDQADRAAAQKRVGLAEKAGQDQVAIEKAQKTFLKMVKQMRKKKRSAASDGAMIEDETNATQVVKASEAEELANLALETMVALREEVAPKWAPSQQPWLLNAADKEVFETCLAMIPKELFEQTAAFAGIQDLRRGQGALATRAADKAMDAVRRGK